IYGHFDPNMPFFTKHGSFWTNSTSELLASTSESGRQARTRNRCNGEGYESVALIPLCSQGETLGLIQLNDSRKGIFTAESIALFERLGDSIALALAQRQAQKTIKQNKDQLESIFRASPVGIGVVTNRILTEVNAHISEMTGYSYNELIGSNSRMLYPTPEDFEYVGKEKYQQIAEKGTGTIETLLRRKDGSVIDVLLSSTPIDTSDLSKGVTFTALDITERKRAEMALADEAVRRRILIEQSRDGIVILDMNCKVYEANQRYAQMLGYSLEEVNELHVWDWDTKWTREQLIEKIAALDEKGDHFETQHLRKDGTLIDMEISSNAAFFGGQKLIFCVCRDISERKRAEKELLESESRNRLILDNSPIAVFLGRDGKYIYSNSMGVNSLGYPSSGEVIGLPIERTVSASCTDAISDRTKNLSNGQANPPMELTIIRPDNKECVLEAVSVPIMLEDGPANLVMGVDVTERKKAEEALKKSEERLLLAMDASDYGFWDLDIDKKQMYCSPQVYNMLGFKEEELQSNIFLNPDIFYPDDKMATLSEMGKTLKKVAPLNLDCRLRHKSGEYLWVSIKGKPFDIDEMGIPHRFVGTMVNITPRVKAEEALLYAKAAATESNRIKSDLLTNVTHELRTPLTAVIGFSDVMLEQENNNLDYLQKRYLQHINKGGRDLLATINKILDFSRYESAELSHLSLGQVSVKQLVHDTIGVLCLQAVKKNQTIYLKIDPDIPEVLADEYKLKQIIYNLVENAIKFTGEKGSIDIEVSLTEDMLQFSVRDNGIGIAKESLDKIFDPFIQIDGSISRKYGGTGMGLALVKRFVELHGGSIHIESKLGKGSDFIFEIPMNLKLEK
ncbi:PAS domain S-box protein, partial [Methanomethylovorans sp.]|uniref:PAS domain S-box protein n=1 Tax=Methanomethylovorans sp. TaxID=2758717 RepID=UPI00351C737C